MFNRWKDFSKFNYWKVFLLISNNFTEQNFLDKSVFNNLSRLDHSAPMINTITNKIKHFSQ